MPIKVTYQDDKGNPIDNPAPPPITVEDQNNWDSMLGEGNKTGVFESDIYNETTRGLDLMSKYGITPERMLDFKADINKKADKQEANPSEIPYIATPPESSAYGNDNPDARSGYIRYLKYQYQQGDQPVKDFATDREAIDAFLKVRQAKIDQSFAGFGDPTQNVNYQAPGTISGFSNAPGVAASTTPAVANAGFPTRDERTGVVTPVAAPQEEITALNDDDDAR